MGLLTIIRKNRQKEKEMRILFLLSTNYPSGLDNAGKTTILKKLNGEDVSGISPTLGFNIKTFVHGRYTLNVWDVGGQRTLRPYWRNYFEQTDAIVWVVDSGDRMRMKDCKEELHSLLLEDRLAGASLLIFANKQDIPGTMSSSEIREALDLSSIKSHQWRILSCSAMTGDNLVEGLDWVVEDVAGRLYYSTADSTSGSLQHVASTVGILLTNRVGLHINTPTDECVFLHKTEYVRRRCDASGNLAASAASGQFWPFAVKRKYMRDLRIDPEGILHREVESLFRSKF